MLSLGHGVFISCFSPHRPSLSPKQVCSRCSITTCWMREYRVSVIVGCSISSDHYFYPYGLPFVTSSFLLSLGNRPPVGTREGSSMFLSVDTGCLPMWPRESTIGPSNITQCSSSFKIYGNMENPTCPVGSGTSLSTLKQSLYPWCQRSTSQMGTWDFGTRAHFG